MTAAKPFPDYQNIVAEFVRTNRLEASPEARLLDLTSEIGELAKELLQGTRYGSRAFLATDAWKSELGDVFFTVICLANATSVDLDQALAQALKKYRVRLDQTGHADSR